ncbi:nuclear transport factor 2 family protein [Ekhidna sp.]
MKNITLLLFFGLSLSSIAQNIKYFRHLRYNHVSPFIELVGTHPIDGNTASKTSHYIFKYDMNGRMSEIINNHYHTEKKHPLASIGSHKVVFSYEDAKEIRTFYNADNTRTRNDRKVYKEVYIYDENNVKKQLNFYDLDDKPMKSNWKIAEYQWQQTSKYIVEKRYNLKGNLVNISPYFPFGITGIVLDENGIPKGHYNLNEQLEITENKHGIASYQDTYDEIGSHIKYTYHDKEDNLAMNQWNYAVGEKLYDRLGNNIKLKLYDAENKLLRTENIYSNASIKEDADSNTSIKVSPIASKEDSLEIKKRSLGYLIALEKMKPKLMDTVLNDNLNKITIDYNRIRAKEYGRATSKKQMIEFARSWNRSGNRFPKNPTNTIEILDIYNRIATVKIFSDNWVEYLHLIKLDNKWEIMNILWQHRDVSKYER